MLLPVTVLVLPLLVPGHLDGFKELLVGLVRLPLEPLKVEDPRKRKGGVKVPDAKGLVEKLKNEAKVI